MQWFYTIDGEQSGPLSDAEIADCAAAGTISDETLVWNETMEAWAPYGSIVPAPSVAEAAPVVPEVVASDSAPAEVELPEGSASCCSCNAPHPVAEMILYEGAYVCATCKPTFFQRVEQGVSVPGTVEYGGFWIRVAAKLIDQMVMSAVMMPFSLIMTAFMGAGMAGAAAGAEDNPAAFIGVIVVFYVVLMVISIAIPLVYHTWMVGKYGATLGKMACRLRVVRSDMSKLTYGRACGRYFGEMVTGMTMAIGYIIAAFDDEKKTLHDIICDTRVIKRP
jgi:uncharacterized RDD family membrane protein YckC